MTDDYTPSFYDIIRPGCVASAAVVAPIVYDLFRPKQVIDVGCGEGHWAKAFETLGAEYVHGLDGEYVESAVIAHFTPVDLSDNFAPDFDQRFDLAVCLEVAEHLPPEAADRFIGNLVELAPVVLFSAAVPQQGGVGHCFPGDTVVSGPAARCSFTRRYDGPLVKLSFASGKFLSATPNHPVLTTNGWVAAGLLTEGDHVIRCLDSERVTSLVPDDHQVPSLIHDVAATVGGSPSMISASVPVASEDFHGDGEGSQVAVVRTDRHLGNRVHSPLSQPPGHPSFPLADVGTALLSRDSSPAQALKGSGLSLGPFHEGINDGLSRLGRAALRCDTVHLSLPTGSNPGSLQTASDRSSAYPELIRQLLRSGSSLIQTDQVSSVQIVDTHENVYNLSTNTGWYVADGVIVHNCNERWPLYWANLFNSYGYEVSAALRWQIWNDDRVENWYRQNLLVAVAEDQAHLYPTLFDTPMAEPFPVVHPVLWDSRTT